MKTKITLIIALIILLIVLMLQGVANYIVSLPVYTRDIDNEVNISVYRARTLFYDIPLIGFWTLPTLEYEVYYTAKIM